MSANTPPIRVVARSGKNGFWIHPFKNACCIAHCGFLKNNVFIIWTRIQPNQWIKLSLGRNRKQLEFFQYSVKLCRNLLLQLKYKCPVAMKHWSKYNVHELQLVKLWKWLWSMQLPKKVICFRSLLIHCALPVGDWLRQHQQYACGWHYDTPIESILHVFWLCPKIKQFWSKLFLLLRQHYSHSNFSWGAILWGVLHGEVIRVQMMFYGKGKWPLRTNESEMKCLLFSPCIVFK